MTKKYAQAGVDIALAEKSLKSIKNDIQSATRPEVLNGIGGFGGLFDLSKNRFKKPVLVSSTDGVGTKLKVAFMTNCHQWIGNDIVNHCLNDIAVMGAEPLYFLDYFGTGHLDKKVFQKVVKGIANACKKANVALIGGETAEMPGFYKTGEYDLVGTIVGIVEKTQILTGETIRPGDKLIGLASSGLHTNGYSLARKILFEQLKIKSTDLLPGTRTTFGRALLKPHLDYSRLIQGVIKKWNKGKSAKQRKDNHVFAAAHITGGGFTGNIPRVLPDNCDAFVDVKAWPEPKLFQFLVEKGEISFQERYEAFNMGIGMVLIVDSTCEKSIMSYCQDQGHKAWSIGEIFPGKKQMKVEESSVL